MSSETGRLRLAAQRVIGPREAGVADAARWLTAAQGQDLAGVLTSLALRTEGATLDDARAAFDAGEVVRSWPMRRTLHAVAAEDLAWMLPLGTPRALAAAARRRPALGIDDAMIERARDEAVEALTGGGRLTRDELLARWEEAGLDPTQGRGSHLLAQLAMTGVLCFGPFSGSGEQQVVLLDEWVPAPRRPEQPVLEWVRRYVASHGPVVADDVLRWLDVPAGPVRAAYLAVREEMETVTLDGVEHLLHPETPARLEQARDAAAGEHLLPGFDEFVLGYKDRSSVLAPEHADRVVPGGNGVFRPTVVLDGRVVGTWRSVGSGGKRRVQRELF